MLGRQEDQFVFSTGTLENDPGQVAGLRMGLGLGGSKRDD